jgi:hypothetical protein
MRKSNEPVLTRLQRLARSKDSGYAAKRVHGHNIEAFRRMDGSVHFRLDGASRSQFDIVAFLFELDALHSSDVPELTDTERLDFAMQTGANWNRDKFGASGTLAWFGKKVYAHAGENYRQALDIAIKIFKAEGGVIRAPYTSGPAQSSSREYVIIYGPQGCGKTKSAPVFAAHYGGHAMDFSNFDYRTDKGVHVLFAQSLHEAQKAFEFCKKYCHVELRIVKYEDALKECGK